MHRNSPLRPCNYGLDCNLFNDISHTSKFSHKEKLLCKFGFNCTNYTSKHSAMYFHPRHNKSNIYSEEVSVPSDKIGHVIGNRQIKLMKIAESSGTTCIKGHNKIIVSADTAEKIEKAKDLIARAAAMGLIFLDRTIIFTNYSPTDMTRFVKPPTKFVIGFGPSINDPYIISKEDAEDTESEIQYTQKVEDSLREALKSLEEFVGKITFQVRLGKTIFFDLSDEAKQQSLSAEMLVKHITDDNTRYKASFCTGTKVEEDVHDVLGTPKIKQSMHFKTLVKHENEYHPINVNISFKGTVVLESVYGKETKHCVTDNLSINQNVLDIRLALQTSSIYQSGNPFYEYSQELVDSLLFENDNVLSLSYLPPKNMIVYTIRHKIRKSYTFEEIFKIDISEVMMSDYTEKLLEPQVDGRIQSVLSEHKTEVEVSLVPWKKAFKHNKCLEGGEIKAHLMQKSTPSEWDTEDLIVHLFSLVEKTKTLSGLLLPMND